MILSFQDSLLHEVTCFSGKWKIPSNLYSFAKSCLQTPFKGFHGMIRSTGVGILRQGN